MTTLMTAQKRHHRRAGDRQQQHSRDATTVVWPSHSSRKIAREHRAEHEQVAVGEVDQLDDAVHHRVAEGDQRVQRTVRDSPMVSTWANWWGPE